METKEDARKRVSFAARKGYNMSVRPKGDGYSIYARYIGVKDEAAPEPEQVREPTF
jgi:hypothetical protein